MSRGDERRKNDLENFEAAFHDALDRARKEPVSAYIAEKLGRPRGGATELDVELFTLESKIERLRAKLGLPPFQVPLARPEPAQTGGGWPPPPEAEATLFPLDLQELYVELIQSGREPEALFAKARYAGPKHRQGADQPGWRLATVDVGENRTPARLALTIYPLPEHPDAALAAQKLRGAMDRLVQWSEKAASTPVRERPRWLNVTYARGSRELAFHAR